MRSCPNDAGNSVDDIVRPTSRTAPAVTPRLVGEAALPTDLAVHPGLPDRVYVLEQLGRVLQFSVDGTAMTVAADLTDRVDRSGALGLEFSPQGDRVYIYYVDANKASTVAEYPVNGDGTIDPAGERVLLKVDQSSDAEHYGGDLSFGPDGYLYISLGDGGTGLAADGGPAGVLATTPTEIKGSILRIDPSPSLYGPYSIPPDNPFALGGAVPEVWAWGVRNPWKMAFDAETGDLWVTDVGLNTFEEVNLLRAVDGQPGGRCSNLGWSALEGGQRLNEAVDVPADAVYPVYVYTHDVGCSVAGGAVYHGGAIPDLDGAFVFSDWCSGTLWGLLADTGEIMTLADEVGSVTAVRTGADGELYALDHAGGRVMRIDPAGS